MMEWVACLKKAEALHADGKISDAIELTRKCSNIYSSDADARGWSLYTLAGYLIEIGRPSEAIELVPEILILNSNLNSKLFISATAADIHIAAGRQDEAKRLLVLVESCIKHWCAGPMLVDEIDISLAERVIHQAQKLGVEIECSSLRMAKIEAETLLIKTLPLSPISPINPKYYNELTPQIRAYIPTISNQSAIRIRLAKNVTLRRLGQFILAFDDTHRMMPINFRSVPEFYRPALERYAAEGTKPLDMNCVAFSMLDQFNQTVNFCHWLVDYMPRTLWADHSGIKFDAVIGPAPLMHDFQRYSMERLLKNRQYISISPEQPLRFEEFYFADNFGDNLFHPLYQCHPELRKLLLAEFSAEISHGRRLDIKLYVPRRHSRRVSNEVALWNMLERKGFEKIDTDSTSLSEQIRKFSAATHVVAPHGAALTNILFCRPNAKILEFFPRFGASAAFFALATSGELDYSCYFDKVIESDVKNHASTVHRNDVDMHVNLDFVEQWLSLSDFSNI